MRERHATIGAKTIFAVAAAVAVVGMGALASVRFGALNPNGITAGLLQLSSTDPVLGSRNAPITIVEFGDFQCPTCGSWYKGQGKLILQNLIDSGKARLVWKDFDYYGPDSTLASKAARAAAEQGRFWDYYNALWSNQGDPNSGWASARNLRLLAENIGLNMTRFDQHFSSDEYLQLITNNYNLGKQLGVQGTPTFFIIGPSGKVVTIVGDQPYDVFQRAAGSVG